MIYRCVPEFVEKVWGDEELAKRYSVRGKIGEVWLCSDFPTKRTELVDQSGKKVSWSAVNELWKSERFPFLVKHIRASQWLSVQVHPDNEFAKKVGEPWGKPEIWVFLNGGKIVNGLKKGALEEIKRGNRDWDSLLNFVEVKAGQAVYIKPGTVHAMGPGVEVYEFQLTSDMTYRFYDWGRGRKLHLKESLAVATEHIAQPFEFKEFSSPYFNIKLMKKNEFTTSKSVYLLEKGTFDDEECAVPTAFISCGKEKVKTTGRIFEMEVSH